MMNGWLTPAFWRKGDYAAVLRLLIESYVFNPLWFLSCDLRAVHFNKFVASHDKANSRRPLTDVVEGGRRPYAFLEEDTPG